MRLDLVSVADAAVGVIGSGEAFRVTNAREAARFLADDVDIALVPSVADPGIFTVVDPLVFDPMIHIDAPRR